MCKTYLLINNAKKSFKTLTECTKAIGIDTSHHSKYIAILAEHVRGTRSVGRQTF